MLEYISASLLLNCWMSTVKYCLISKAPWLLATANLEQQKEAHLVGILDPVVEVGQLVEQLLRLIVHARGLRPRVLLLYAQEGISGGIQVLLQCMLREADCIS